MRSKKSIYAVVCLLGALPALAAGQDARAVLEAAAKTMGAGGVKTLEYSGMGSSAGVGQNKNPRSPWPMSRVSAYQSQIDLGAGSAHVHMVRMQGTSDQYISVNGPWDSQYRFWADPFGFLKGALANTATATTAVIDGATYNVVTYSVQNKYRVSGYFDSKNVLDRVQTHIHNDVLGDMPVEAWFSEYKDFGGVAFPGMIIEKQGGFPVLILAVSDVKPNAPVSIQVPPEPAKPAAPIVQSEKMADGVFYLRGGTHHSVAVEFADHVVVIEAPLNSQRSLAVIAEVKKLIPNKPIRYVVNTHHHFDHSGGLRSYVNEGATIVTSELNKEFYQSAMAAPRIDTVRDKKVLSDGTRWLELYAIAGNQHADGMLMVFLPKEKLLIEVDVYTPGPASAVSANAVNLVENVEKLKLNFETVLPLHGPGAASRTDLYAAIGRPAPNLSEILAPLPVQSSKATDPGQILEKACAGCHSLNRVQSQSLTRAEWQSVVDRMKERGAEVADHDMSGLVDYLAKTYGHK